VALRGLVGILGVQAGCSELSAGCIYLSASLVADDGFKACLHEDVFEVLDCRPGRSLKRAAFVGVELDQVDGGVDAFEQGDHGLGIGRRVVDVLHHAVFEADAPARLALICLDRRDKFMQRILCCNRHDPLSFPVGGGMEGDSKSHLQGFVGEPLDSDWDAAGAYGYVALTDVRARVVVEYARRTNDFVVIVEWLAHAHVDDVVYFVDGCSGLIDLVDNFGGGEVALKSQSPGRTQCTPHATAGLTRDAKGLALPGAGIGQQDRLEARTVAAGKDELDRAVRIDEFLNSLKLRYKVALPRKAQAILLRQGGDVVDPRGVMSMDE